VSLWGWLWPRKENPGKLRIHLAPDTGDESVSLVLPLGVLRMIVVLVIAGLLALLVLLFSSSSLILEKRKNEILERQLKQNAVQLSHLNSLERQLQESALLLYRMQSMLVNGGEFPDSLLPEQVIREMQADELLLAEAGHLQRGEVQLLNSVPSAWPLRGWVTREFQGGRGPEYHAGMDITAETGTPVRAAGDGVVLVAGANDEYGNFVILDHGFGLTSMYGHNSLLAVHKEDRVLRGDIVAYVGSTGHSTAPHLHFEIRRNGVPEDPRQYLLN